MSSTSNISQKESGVKVPLLIYKAILTVCCGVLSTAAMGQCTVPWGSTTVSNNVQAATGVTYTLVSTAICNDGVSWVPNGENCRITFPAGTNASGITSGTINGNPITFNALGATLIDFDTPIDLLNNTVVTIVLVGITNPAAGTYTTLTFQADNDDGDLTTFNTSNYTIVPPTPSPVADFSGTPTSACLGGTVVFSDLSTNTPTSWSWTFASGTPATSTSQNPSIVYSSVGTFDVSLTATNAGGSDTKTVVGYITVASCAPPMVHNVEIANTGAGVNLLSNLMVDASGTLTMTQGAFTTGTDSVIVSNTASAAVTAGNSTSYVIGYLRRYINVAGSYDFPVGEVGNGYQLANINFTAATTISRLTARFDPWTVLAPALGSTECAVTYDENALDNGFWTLTPNIGGASGTYTTTLYNAGYTNAGGAWGVMRDDGSGWALINGTCNVTGPATVQRTAMTTGWGKFANAQESGTLPITLLSFTGENVGDQNLLKWVTTSESGNDYFTLERSQNGMDFTAIGTVDGAGTSNYLIGYDFPDKEPFEGINYYRLKQTDFDGTTSYSQIISIIFRSSVDLISMSAYPNPAKNILNMDFDCLIDTKCIATLRDLTGRIVINAEFDLIRGEQQLQLDISNCAYGAYVLTVTNNDQVICVNKVLIN